MVAGGVDPPAPAPSATTAIRSRLVPRRGVTALAALVALLALAGCALGKRPYFSDQPFQPGTLTGDLAADAVLAKLDAGITGATTLAYNGAVKFGVHEFAAVVLADGANRKVTLSNAIYRQTAAGAQTCFVDGSRPCQDGIDAAAASDTTLTMDFYAADAATQLRNHVSRAVGPGQAHNETIAGQPATCVDIPLPSDGGTALATYCALDNGVVARMDNGAVSVELVMFLASADAAEFTFQ